MSITAASASDTGCGFSSDCGHSSPADRDITSDSFISASDTSCILSSDRGQCSVSGNRQLRIYVILLDTGSPISCTQFICPLEDDFHIPGSRFYFQGTLTSNSLIFIYVYSVQCKNRTCGFLHTDPCAGTVVFIIPLCAVDGQVRPIKDQKIVLITVIKILGSIANDYKGSRHFFIFGCKRRLFHRIIRHCRRRIVRNCRRVLFVILTGLLLLLFFARLLRRIGLGISGSVFFALCTFFGRAAWFFVFLFSAILACRRAVLLSGISTCLVPILFSGWTAGIFSFCFLPAGCTFFHFFRTSRFFLNR